jgi:lipoyl(octanoyl) transferase
MLDVLTSFARDLGRMSYASAWELQKKLVAERKAGISGDTLLLVEHPHVITVGRSAHREHILNVPEEVEVHETNRGGDVTYHGPGQLVGYPIFDLAAMGKKDVAWYMRSIEDVLIASLDDFGIAATRLAGLTGVWVGEDKIAAMGVHLSRWVTSHGFALNVNPDLAYFDCIIPCGIRDHGVTSMQRVLGRPIDMEAVKESVVRSFQRVFLLS